MNTPVNQVPSTTICPCSCTCSPPYVSHYRVIQSARCAVHHHGAGLVSPVPVRTTSHCWARCRGAAITSSGRQAKTSLSRSGEGGGVLTAASNPAQPAVSAAAPKTGATVVPNTRAQLYAAIGGPDITGRSSGSDGGLDRIISASQKFMAHRPEKPVGRSVVRAGGASKLCRVHRSWPDLTQSLDRGCTVKRGMCLLPGPPFSFKGVLNF